MKNDMINYFLVETESEQFLNYPKRDKKNPTKDEVHYLKILQVTTFIIDESTLPTAVFGESPIFH